MSDLNNVEPGFPTAGRLAEYDINFFEGAVGGLRVDEVDDGEDEGIDYSEDHVGFVADGGEGDGGDHDDLCNVSKSFGLIEK